MMGWDVGFSSEASGSSCIMIIFMSHSHMDHGKLLLQRQSSGPWGGD